MKKHGLGLRVSSPNASLKFLIEQLLSRALATTDSSFCIALEASLCSSNDPVSIDILPRKEDLGVFIEQRSAEVVSSQTVRCFPESINPTETMARNPCFALCCEQLVFEENEDLPMRLFGGSLAIATDER